jgi:hypothetical protein
MLYELTASFCSHESAAALSTAPRMTSLSYGTCNIQAPGQKPLFDSHEIFEQLIVSARPSHVPNMVGIGWQDRLCIQVGKIQTDVAFSNEALSATVK